MATLTKAELIDSVYEKVGFSKKEAADLVELIFESIKEELCKGDSIKISGFGKFRVRQKKARMGRNPQTGQAMEISARKVLTFTPSRILRDGINGKSTQLPSQASASDADHDDESNAESD
jgi:integration host factor subunit alpha